MKKLLIVVDYQNDFVNGSLGSPYAAAIEETVCAKIRAYRAAGDDVAFTFDTHEADYLDTQEGKKLPIPHCMEGTDGWALYGKTAAMFEEGDCCFKKDCFGSADLFTYLKASSYMSVELIGVVTNICVISNAVLAKTALPETPVFVDASCTASNDPILHEKALDVLESMQVEVIGR